MSEQYEAKRFLQACSICKKSAVERNKQLFVRNRGDDFVIVDEYANDWLFRAYPGGRTVLSMEGKGLT